VAKLSKQEIEEIVERDMPGYQVVQHEPETADRAIQETSADEVAPDIDTLREKYLGEDTDDNPGHETERSSAEPDGDSEEENTDDAIVAVQPKETGDPFDHAARPKSIVVSGKDRRVIGSQG
jgi:hypothetical protein